MNGVSVYPGQKTQNAPTWQVENQGRGGCFFVIFLSFRLTPDTEKTVQQQGINFIFLFNYCNH